MKKTLKFRLSSDSIQSVIDELESEKKRVKKLVPELCRRLAEEGAAAARAAYGDSVTVSVVPIENGYSIIASGREVAFMEFGAGIYTDTTHPLAGNVDNQGLPVYPGSYSEEHARQFVNYGYWIHDGKKIEGVQPRYGLWAADQAIADSIKEVVREVFADD